MYTSILVPLDGSANAEWALPPAISIARATGAAISLITVQVPIPVLAAGMSVLPPTEPIIEASDSSDYLRHTADRIAAEGVSAVTLGVVEPSALVLATIGGEIAHRAEVMGAGLIVMTTHARSAVPRMFLGSVANDVVRHSQIPVLMIRPDGEETPDLHSTVGFREVLIALDGSTFSEEVLADAVELGRLYGARFTLLTVLEPPHLYAAPVEIAVVPVEDVAWDELKRNAQTYSDGIAEKLRKRDLQVTTMFIEDAGPAEAIVRAARETGADLIAMTTHARTAVATLFLGSVANQVLRTSHVPVLLYRPREA